jgi:mRNA interferase MazF
MFEQCDIAQFRSTPGRGQEMLGCRPARVISNRHDNLGTSMTLACPITTVDNGLPLHFRLSAGIGTAGFVVVGQLRALDLAARGARRIERLEDYALRAAIAECVISCV